MARRRTIAFRKEFSPFLSEIPTHSRTNDREDMMFPQGSTRFDAERADPHKYEKDGPMSRHRESRTATICFACHGVFIATVCGLLLAKPALASTDTLDRQLLKNAPKVIQYLKDHGHQTVGILKFRVKKGDAPASDRVGSLNLNLATRLELALLLTMDLDHPLNVIHDASAMAAQLPGADHFNPGGRRALFAGRYRLAWGSKQVEADAFLTGLVIVSPDLRSLDVGIMGFGRDSKRLEEVVRFTASTDVPALIDVGESFQTRGFFDGGRVEIVRDEAIVSAMRIKKAEQANPIQDASAPVRLDVYYDGQRVPLETCGGELMIKEPREGQKVIFVLRKVDDTPTRYGVVLMINGQNNLLMGRATTPSSPMWILNRKLPVAAVLGFQTENHSLEPFRILSARSG